MIFTQESVAPQIAQLLQEYSGLVVVQSDAQLVHLHGQILVFRVFNDFPLRKTYTLDLFIPLGTDKLPHVNDSGHHIRPGYHHIYKNGDLCLATDVEIRFRFINGFNLIEWMSEFVELYYFSYEYFERYGVFPFGERDHGLLGVLQTYQDILLAKDMRETYELLRFIKNSPYRGHHLCPCGSGKSIRGCHGHSMLRIYKDPRLHEIIASDFEEIDKELHEENERRIHSRKAK